MTTKEKVRKFYNKISEFREKFIYSPSEEYNTNEILKIIKKTLNRKGEILDVGCGSGNFIEAMTKNNYVNLVGVDISNQMIKLAKNKINGNFVLGDIENLPLKDSVFDGGICINTLPHTQNPYKCISEIRRTLRKNGKIIVCVENDLGKKFREIISSRNKSIIEQPRNNEKIFTANKLSTIFEKMGFDVNYVYKKGFLIPRISDKNIKISILLSKLAEKLPVIRTFAKNIIIEVQKK